MTEPVPDTTKAYLAAVMDNFGAMNVRTLSTGTTQPMIFCSGNRPVVLRMLGDLTRTKVVKTSRDYSKHLCNEHCPDRHFEAQSNSMRWQITGMKATIFLFNILPFMVVRKVEAKAVFDAGIDSNFKGITVEAMRDLGWDIPDLDAMKDIDFARGFAPS